MTSIRLLLALLLTSCAACGSGLSAADRQQFGANPLAVWTPLSAYELQALKARQSALSGEYRALLSLALVASGAPRDADELAELTQKVEAFVGRHRAALTAIGDPAQRGQRLLQLMHTELLDPDGDGQLAKYRSEQSQLTIALADGSYNCISSALLYMVLARAVGLPVRGAQMPHHAFIELGTGSQRYDVETTSPQGFGLRHDQAWFTAQAGQWARDRGLASVTWQQYRTRTMLSPLQLVAANMINQHSSTDRMDAADSNRLRELRAELLPGDVSAQIARMAVFTRERNALDQTGAHATIVKMYTAVEPALAAITQRMGGDPAIRNQLAWHRSNYAMALQSAGRWQLAEGWLKVAAGLAGTVVDRARIENNILGAVWSQAHTLAENGDFIGGQRIMGGWDALCRRSPWCSKNHYWLYAQWATEAFDREDWARAIERSRVVVQRAPPDLLGNARRNLEAAWFNLAVTHANRGDRARARQLLAQCRQENPWATRCAARF